MLPFLKKNPEKSKTASAPAWHPNFRNYAQLPDTKAVRTSFFLNGLCALLAAALLLAVIYQEYSLASLKEQIDEWQQKIDQVEPASKKTVTLYRQFQQEARKVEDLSSFLKGGRLTVSDFIIHLGETLPPGVALSYIEYNANGVILRGFVEGTSAEASGLASKYEKQLREDEKISSVFESVSLPALPVRDAQTGRLSFELRLKFPAQAKGGKK